MKHYNPSITERANRILNLKTGDSMPDEVEGPVAVIPLTPASRIVRSNEAFNATSATIFTTPTDRDFYLTAYQLSVIKDATSTSLRTELLVTIDGSVRLIAQIASLTLTAQSESVACSLPCAIKLDRGSNITLQTGSAVANIRAFASIVGYIEEVART